MAVKNNVYRLLPLTLAMLWGSAAANVWVFEPSISLDQRFDDNYYLELDNPNTLSATRAVGELGLSRESQAASIRGLVRIDGLLTASNDDADNDLDSNQIVAFEAKLRSARTRYGMYVGFKQDTPSRDIAADLSDPDSLASDTGLDLTESSDVGRREITLTPKFEYDVTRRLVFNTKATVTLVDHDTPDAQDTIYERYLSLLPRDDNGNIIGEVLPYNEVTIADAGNVFSPSGELDDYQEAELELGLRFKLSTITTLTTKLTLSRFNADVLVDPFAIVPFENLAPDSSEPGIRRRPRRESISTTSKFELGYERFLTETLQLGVSGGVYTNTTDTTDTLRAEDRPGEEIPAERLEPLESDNDGWLASVSLTKDAGQTRYTGRFAVDVQPSSVGTQVETQELTGDVFHVLSPRINLSMRARAYEPDRLAAKESDRFARRFISIEPKVEWNYTRNWTVSAAYRYRRQKARIDPVSAESNAVLFSIKYTPPSEVRDAARANGL